MQDTGLDVGHLRQTLSFVSCFPTYLVFLLVDESINRATRRATHTASGAAGPVLTQARWPTSGVDQREEV